MIFAFEYSLKNKISIENLGKKKKKKKKDEDVSSRPNIDQAFFVQSHQKL